MNLDTKDKQLIALLQLNARTPVADLARTVFLARSTVQERIKRLEQAGIIEGYSVRLNPERLGQQGISSRVAVSVRAAYQSSVIKALSLMPEVLCCETVSGQFDLFLEVSTETPAQLDAVVERISALEGVERTESSIILRQFFNRNP